MKVASVAELHRYPFKSMLGERLAEAPLAEDGIRGDRAWAARDEGRGGIEGARKLPALLGCRFQFPAPQRHQCRTEQLDARVPRREVLLLVQIQEGRGAHDIDHDKYQVREDQQDEQNPYGLVRIRKIPSVVRVPWALANSSHSFDWNFDPLSIQISFGIE